MRCPICKSGQIKTSLTNSTHYTCFIYCLEEGCGFSVSVVIEPKELSIIYRKSGTIAEVINIPHET